ncbi:MAG: DUF1934 domain-containing protein [Clostridia bacterium]|nr:DUF1934 domain-containing protein [Clostridia bacterium]
MRDTEKKEVRIRMETVSDSEKMSYKYNGFFQIKNGKKYLMYSDGNEKCSVTSDGKIVRLSRFTTKSTMIFEKDSEHISSYLTPMGSLPLCVATKTVSDKLCEDGTLFLKYNLSVGDTEPIENKIKITIEEIKNVSK